MNISLPPSMLDWIRKASESDAGGAPAKDPWSNAPGDRTFEDDYAAAAETSGPFTVPWDPRESDAPDWSTPGDDASNDLVRPLAQPRGTPPRTESSGESEASEQNEISQPPLLFDRAAEPGPADPSPVSRYSEGFMSWLKRLLR